MHFRYISTPRDHPFINTKFSEKLIPLTPDTYAYVCVSGGKKY